MDIKPAKRVKWDMATPSEKETMFKPLEEQLVKQSELMDYIVNMLEQIREDIAVDPFDNLSLPDSDDEEVEPTPRPSEDDDSEKEVDYPEEPSTSEESEEETLQL